MLSCLAFIPRGAAKETPEQQELSAEEMNQLIQKQAGMSMQDLQADEDGAALEDSDSDSDAGMDEEDEKKEAVADEEDEPLDDKEAQLLKELKMDGYDEEEEGAELFLGGQKLLVHETNADDPYITVPDHEDFDEEDEEDLTIKRDDVLVAVGRTEEEASNIEVYLYEEESGNLYVHHDFNLPSFPLSLCWMDCDPRSDVSAPTDSSSNGGFTSSVDADRGNFLAVGTFQTGIEIWNLDVLDVLEPVATLGGRLEPDAEAIKREMEAQSKGKKKGSKAKMSAAMAAKLMGELKPGSHSDAVMCLAWHPAFRTRLASGSADHTVKLWDVVTQQCVRTFDSLHQSKVQSINWNMVEPNILLTGAYDQTVCVVDVRTQATGTEGVMRFPVSADIEQVKWSPHHPFLFAAALENGQVQFFDARNTAAKTPLFTVAAHNQPCTNLSFNPALPTCFLTASLDKTVKIWDFDPQPTLISSKDMKAAGSLFTAAFDVNYPHLMAAGGDKAKLAIWDLREDAKCRARYGEECDGQGKKSAFTMPEPAAAGAAASSTPASAESGEKKKKKKKKMKTALKRSAAKEGDASDEE